MAAPADNSSLGRLPGPGNAALADALFERVSKHLDERMESKHSELVDRVQEQVQESIASALASLPALVHKGKKKQDRNNGDLLQQLAAAIGAEPAAGAAAQDGSSSSNSDSSDSEADGNSAPAKQRARGNAGNSNAPPILSVASANIDERLAPSVLQNAQLYGGSLLKWANAVDWKHLRNKNEALAWGELVDVLLAEGVAKSSLGIELALRRLTGVHMADTTGNWKLCEALKWAGGPNNTLLARDNLLAAMKQATKLDKLMSGSDHSKSGSAPGKSFKKNPFKPKKYQQQQSNASARTASTKPQSGGQNGANGGAQDK
jgi:hypothetical protein